MSLGIVCGCEGLLRPFGQQAICARCKQSYQLSDLKTILKLLEKVNYEPASADQQGPTDEEKHAALSMAVRRLVRLKLKVMDLEELHLQPARPAPAPPPRPAPAYAGSTTTSTWSAWAGNSPMGGYWYVRVTVG